MVYRSVKMHWRNPTFWGSFLFTSLRILSNMISHFSEINIEKHLFMCYTRTRLPDLFIKNFSHQPVQPACIFQAGYVLSSFYYLSLPDDICNTYDFSSGTTLKQRWTHCDKKMAATQTDVAKGGRGFAETRAF